MADQSFAEWAQSQEHKPEDKVTNAQKLTAPYILNKYKTWGEVYKAAGVKAPTITTKPKSDSIIELGFNYLKLNSQYQTALSDRGVWKQIAQDPNESPERRQEALQKFQAASDKVKDLQSKIDVVERKYDKIEGGKEVRKIQAAYQDLLEEKALLINPNDPRADKINKEIDKLAKDYQSAFSKFTGTRVSYSVAKANLTKVDLGKIGAQEPKEPVSAPPSVVGQQPTKGTTPTSTSAPAPTSTPTPAPKPFKVPSAKSGDKKPTPVKSAEEKQTEALATAQKDFALPETLFKNVPSLNAILEDYVAGRIVGEDALRQKIRNDIWYRQNSDEIKKRFIQKFNYDDLVSKGQATGSTDYEKQIAAIETNLKKKAALMGSAAASDPAALRKAAENLYITNRSEDDSYITDFLAAAIKPMAGMIGGKVTEGYTGQALQNYQTLQSVAKANGFKVSDIIPGGANEAQLLGMIASGAVDINRVAQDARKLAAQGQPQYVRELLGQGYNLDQVYSPYRQTMANVLEISDPNQIDLNDPTLRMAITDKGDMNLFDFKKALRADKRWQYTEGARNEVSAATLQVLRDFGFQG